MRQSRSERKTLFVATELYLLPLIYQEEKPSMAWIVKDEVLSGYGAQKLLSAFTFDHMKMDWDQEDEHRLDMGFDYAPFENKNHPDYERNRKIAKKVAAVGKLWKERLSDAGIRFHFDKPADIGKLVNNVDEIGIFLGIEHDVNALFENVPVEDIIA